MPFGSPNAFELEPSVINLPVSFSIIGEMGFAKAEPFFFLRFPVKSKK